MPVDLVSRFVLTPMRCTLNLHGVVISLATNSPVLLDRITDLSPECANGESDQPACDWRIVTEAVTEADSDEECEPDSIASRYVGHEGLSLITVGKCSFLAYDERLRKGVSFVSERLVGNPRLFAETFLPALVSLLPGRTQQW